MNRTNGMKTPDRKERAELFLKLLDPNRSILGFIIGTACLAALVQWLFNAAKYFSAGDADLQFKFEGFIFLASFFLAAFIVVRDYLRLRQRRLGQITTREHIPQPRQGLILLVGPLPATSPASIDLHLPRLKHCWLLTTKGSLKTARQIARRYSRKQIDFHMGPSYEVDLDRIQSTYDVVVRILDHEASSFGLDKAEVISDITGGVKVMTAGMTLACLARNAEMVYMKKPRDKTGKPIEEEPFQPVLIDTEFILN